MKTKKHKLHPCKCGKPIGVVTIRVNRNWLCTDCIHDQGWMLCGQHKSGPVWFSENSRIGCPVCARKKSADMLKSKCPHKASCDYPTGGNSVWVDSHELTPTDISWLKAQGIVV